MSQANKISWVALCLNTGLNVLGLIAILICNIWRQGCDFLILYLYGILFLGPPLFLAALLMAPAGTYRVNAAPRWLLLFNLGIGALLLLICLRVALH